MFMLPTVFSVPNSFHPDISLSSSWSLSDECPFASQDNSIPSPVPSAVTASMTEDPSSNVSMSLAAADRERNYK